MFRTGHIIWTHVSLRKIHQDNVSSISIIRLDITNVYFDTQIYANVLKQYSSLIKNNDLKE